MNKNYVILLLGIAGLFIAAYIYLESGANYGGYISSNSQNPAIESVLSLSYQALNSSEVQGILYMREEEKLARDVYLKLYEMWKLPIFKNIAESEQIRMDLVKALIIKYNLTDPY